jgi:uncharacterized protein YkwD
MPVRLRRPSLLAAAALFMAQPATAVESASGMPVASEHTHQLARAINEYRQQHGLGPLALDEDLNLLAAEHSRAMATRQQLSHDGFRARMERTGKRLCVENVARNFPTAAALLDGWRNSPAHHRNLLEPGVSAMGLAVTARYVTFFACA